MRVRWQAYDDAGPLGRLRRLFDRRGNRSGRAWRPSAEWLSMMEGSASVAPSPLQGVVAVGQKVEASGLVVELIAIEVRERGAILYWRAHSARDILILGAEASVTDQPGTAYRVAPAGGEGNNRSWAGQMIVLPRPPAGVLIRLKIDYFGPSPDRPVPPQIIPERIEGPWTFEVQIPGDLE